MSGNVQKCVEKCETSFLPGCFPNFRCIFTGMECIMRNQTDRMTVPSPIGDIRRNYASIRTAKKKSV